LEPEPTCRSRARQAAPIPAPAQANEQPDAQRPEGQVPPQMIGHGHAPSARREKQAGRERPHTHAPPGARARRPTAPAKRALLLGGPLYRRGGSMSSEKTDLVQYRRQGVSAEGGRSAGIHR